MHSFAFHSFSYVCSTTVGKPMIHSPSDVSGSLTVCLNACVIHLTSSHHKGILSSHIIVRRVNTVQYFERDHIHITFITVYCYNYSIL